MSKTSKEAAELRDVAAQLEQLGREHPSWSMIHTIVLNATDHIQALAGVIEARQDAARKSS